MRQAVRGDLVSGERLAEQIGAAFQQVRHDEERRAHVAAAEQVAESREHLADRLDSRECPSPAPRPP